MTISQFVRKWYVVGPAIVAAFAGLASISGAVDTVAQSAIFDIATRDYVNGEVVKVSDALAGQARLLRSLANLSADKNVSDLEYQLSTTRERLLQIERDLAVSPTVSLQLLRQDTEAKIEGLERELERAKCYRAEIISEQGHDCRPLE